MIELAVPKKRRPYTVLCGQCGEMPKSCQCAEEQEEKKKREIETVLAGSGRSTVTPHSPKEAV